MERAKVSDCLQIHFLVLSWVGWYRPMVYYESRAKRIFFKLYRNFTMILIIVYDLQHVIFLAQSLDVMDNMIASLLILLTAINNMFKVIALYSNTKRLRHILDVLDGPHFEPLDEEDHEILMNNSKVMRNMLKLCYASVCLCCTLWCIAPFTNRAKGVDAIIPGYYPVNKNSNAGFAFVVIYENMVMAWLGIGHTTMDVMIASLYILVRAELLMMRNHLQHIADPHDITANTNRYNYRDDNPEYAKKLKERFIYNVEKYDKIFWLTNEIQSIFNNAIVVQLIVSACILCIVVYKLVQIVSISFDFFYLIQYMFSLGVELFIYCYYGTQAEYASIFVNDSLFASEWYTLSPKFRKMMILAMTRWAQPLKPRAAYIIPLSLTTFIGVLRLSYSLYTILSTT